MSSKPVTESCPGTACRGRRPSRVRHRHQVVGEDDCGRRLGEVEKVRVAAAPDSAEKSASTQVPPRTPVPRPRAHRPTPYGATGRAPSTGGRRRARCAGARARRGARPAARMPGASSTPSVAATSSPTRGPDDDGRQAELVEQRGTRVVDLEVGDEDAVDAALLGQPSGRSRRRRARRPSAAARGRAGTAPSRGRR